MVVRNPHGCIGQVCRRCRKCSCGAYPGAYLKIYPSLHGRRDVNRRSTYSGSPHGRKALAAASRTTLAPVSGFLDVPSVDWLGSRRRPERPEGSGRRLLSLTALRPPFLSA